MSIRSLLAATVLLGASAWAQTTLPDVPQTAEQAAAQRVQVESLRSHAEKRYVEEQNVCYGKFLVSNCLDAAKKTHSRAMIEARALEKGVRDFEREEHRRAIEIKEAKRKVEFDSRDAEQQMQAEHYREEEVSKATERERKLAEKNRQATEGRKKTEAEQADRREKQVKRAKQDVERAAKKAAKSTTPRIPSTD
jgi:colicin import membrane protein